MEPENKNLNTPEKNTPGLLTFTEVVLEELSQYYIDPKKKYIPPYHFFEYNGKSYATLGGVFNNTGFRKSGKTTTSCIHMAVALAGAIGWGGFHVPERTMEHIGHDLFVLYIDTEMEPAETAKMQERVYRLIDFLPREDIEKRFFVFNFRSVSVSTNETSKEKRRRLIGLCIDKYHPDIVFLDGLRDIVKDINSPDEATETTEYLMDLAKDKNICIWSCLHLNPTDDKKMRGWVGTEMDNKGTGTFKTTKNKNKKTGVVTYTISHEAVRDQDVDDIHFRIIDDNEHIGIPEIIENPHQGSQGKGKGETATPKETLHVSGFVESIKVILSPKGKSLFWGQIRDGLIKRFGITIEQSNEVLKQAAKERIIVQIVCAGERKWQLNPDENAIPF